MHLSWRWCFMLHQQKGNRWNSPWIVPTKTWRESRWQQTICRLTRWHWALIKWIFTCKGITKQMKFQARSCKTISFFRWKWRATKRRFRDHKHRNRLSLTRNKRLFSRIKKRELRWQGRSPTPLISRKERHLWCWWWQEVGNKTEMRRCLNTDLLPSLPTILHAMASQHCVTTTAISANQKGEMWRMQRHKTSYKMPKRASTTWGNNMNLERLACWDIARVATSPSSWVHSSKWISSLAWPLWAWKGMKRWQNKWTNVWKSQVKKCGWRWLNIGN